MTRHHEIRTKYPRQFGKHHQSAVRESVRVPFQTLRAEAILTTHARRPHS